MLRELEVLENAIATKNELKQIKTAEYHRRPKRFKTFRSQLPFYLMLLPGVIILLINNYLPMIGVIIPFIDYRFNSNFFTSLFTSKFVGFDNFKFLFMSNDILESTRNTLLYNFVFISLDLIIPVALAIMLTELFSKKFSKLYQSVIFLPYFLSWIIVSYLAYSFLSYDSGFINRTVLQLFGVAKFDWYSSPQVWPFILVFFHLWKYTGYNLVIYIASISGISNEYYEAATIDGATKMQQIRFITLPMLKTVMIIVSLLAVGRIFNSDFGMFYNVPRDIGILYSTTSVIDTYVYRCLSKLNDVGMSSAAGLYQAVLGCIMVFAANLIVRKIDKDSALF
jgi:putative aldouronate transport system permease protein